MTSYEKGVFIRGLSFFSWVEGMKLESGDRVLYVWLDGDVTTSELVTHGTWDTWQEHWVGIPAHYELPDLEDPMTVHAIMILLGKQLGLNPPPYLHQLDGRFAVKTSRGRLSKWQASSIDALFEALRLAEKGAKLEASKDPSRAEDPTQTNAEGA